MINENLKISDAVAALTWNLMFTSKGTLNTVLQLVPTYGSDIKLFQWRSNFKTAQPLG